MITYKLITKEDKEKLNELIKDVLNSLERKDFFIPFSKDKMQNMFNVNKIMAYGAYDGDKLIGTAQLFLGEEYLEETKKILNLENQKVSKLGGYMISENYRNRGIGKKLEAVIIEKAKKLGYKYAFVIVHPENIPSKKVIEFSGAKLVKTTNIGEYLRDIYLLEL